jgi:rubredoxin-NAD+ reductase
MSASETISNAAWQCLLCNYVYDEARGDPAHGLAPGTKWEDVSDDWVCPDCGAGKDEFSLKDY